MAKLHLEVVSPERLILEKDVDSFVTRAQDGDVGVLPGHSPLFTSLQEGVLYFRENGKKKALAVMGGFLQVQDNKATVLTEAAELADEIDELRAKHAKERAEARLRDKGVPSAERKASDVDYARAEAALRRSLIRLRAREFRGD